MACVLVAVIALLLGNLHLGIGTDTEKEDITGKKSIAKQYVISSPFNNVRQRQNVPLMYQPQLQSFPNFYQPQPQSFPNFYQPQPQVIPIIISLPAPEHEHEPEISYEFVDPSYFYPPEPQPSRNSGSGTNLGTFLAILLLMDQLDSTAAPATTTQNPDDGCTYEEWGTCSAFCKGTQTRNKICSGVVQSDSRDCNTQVGFLSNGWYRASNCYDYLLSAEDLNYADAQSACADLGAELASVGMRDAAVRGEVVDALHVAGQTLFAYIGLDRIDGSWGWLDGSNTVPNFWDVSEPDAGDCAVLVSGNPESGHDSNCNTLYNSYCERAAT